MPDQNEKLGVSKSKRPKSCKHHVHLAGLELLLFESLVLCLKDLNVGQLMLPQCL